MKHGQKTSRLLCPWDFPGKKAGVGCHALLQVIFPTQGSNWHLMSPALAGRFFTTRATGEAPFMGIETLGIVLLQVISLQSPAPKSEGIKGPRQPSLFLTPSECVC